LDAGGIAEGGKTREFPQSAHAAATGGHRPRLPDRVLHRRGSSAMMKEPEAGKPPGRG
jgi:hypothetical protein